MSPEKVVAHVLDNQSFSILEESIKIDIQQILQYSEVTFLDVTDPSLNLGDAGSAESATRQVQFGSQLLLRITGSFSQSLYIFTNSTIVKYHGHVQSPNYEPI